MHARRAGAADYTLRSRVGERTAHSDSVSALRSRWLPLRSTWRQWALRYSAMGRRRGSGLRRRNPCFATNQPSHLHPNRDAGKRHLNADAGDGHIATVDFPLQFDSRGRTATVGLDAHIRDLIEQVLFTSPGERVNRPTFGSGLLQLVFAPNREELAAATQLLVQGALQQWLGDLIQVDAVKVESVDATLQVTIQYTIRRNQTRQVAQFTRGATV